MPFPITAVLPAREQWRPRQKTRTTPECRPRPAPRPRTNPAAQSLCAPQILGVSGLGMRAKSLSVCTLTADGSSSAANASFMFTPSSFVEVRRHVCRKDGAIDQESIPAKETLAMPDSRSEYDRKCHPPVVLPGAGKLIAAFPVM